jgi:putative transposase
LVWCTKYRRKALREGADETVKAYLTELCACHSYDLSAIEVMEDHVHLFLSFSPKLSISSVVKDLKGSSARYMFVKHPEIKRFLWGGHMWNPSYYVGTAGSVSKEAIQRYIEEQRTSEQS